MNKGILTVVVVFCLGFCLATPGFAQKQDAQDTTFQKNVRAAQAKTKTLPDILHYQYSTEQSDPSNVSDAMPRPLPVLAPFSSINAGLAGVYQSSIAWGDYDNDGYLDILMTGLTASNTKTSKVYHNNGNGTFTDINAGLQGIQSGRAAWGDYDNDGYLDIVIAGHISKIYHNNGNGTFTDINAGLLGVVSDGSVAWGDYNNDGRLDILLTGNNGAGGYISKIYRNNGDGSFTDINANLTGGAAGSVAWGDYDNDGYLDILLTGYQSSTNSISKIYHNNHNGTFTDINAGLAEVNQGSAAWGDYDNDGYLDILLTGNTGNNHISAVYHNNGNGTFTDINAGLIGIFQSNAVWGDYNNDGYLDVLLTGLSNHVVGSPWTPVARVYRNNGNGTFTDINAGLAGVCSSSVAWGDYNNDGYLDILVSGNTTNLSWNLAPTSKVYRNNGGSLGLPVNTAPGALSGLQSIVQGNKVTLSWQKGSDAQTPQNGLNYNIYIGRTPNSVGVFSPMANIANGWRRIPALGGQNENTSWTIKGLASGTYYWGVQAIDTGFMGSLFATGTFTVSGTPEPWPYFLQD